MIGNKSNKQRGRVLRSNMKSMDVLEKSRKYADVSEGYDSESSPYNLRSARSSTEGNTSKGGRKSSSYKVIDTASVGAKKRVKFVSNDEKVQSSMPDDYHYLIGTIHRDDEDLLTYKSQ